MENDPGRRAVVVVGIRGDRSERDVMLQRPVQQVQRNPALVWKRTSAGT